MVLMSDHPMMFWSPEGTGEQAVTVTAATRSDLLEDLGTRMCARAPFAVATLNLDHVVKFRQDPGFHTAYLAHSHVTADGNPIVWLSGLAGQPVELVPGSELIDPLMQFCAAQGVPVAFLGSTEATLETAATVLTDRYPGLEVVAMIAPEMGFDPTGAAAQTHIEALRRSKAGLCCLALGAPKQEVFAAHALEQGLSMGFISIGAGLDFIAGTQTRAPLWVRKIASEWIWRMLSNPKRLAARYMACIAILPSLSLRAAKQRRSKS